MRPTRREAAAAEARPERPTAEATPPTLQAAEEPAAEGPPPRTPAAEASAAAEGDPAEDADADEATAERAAPDDARALADAAVGRGRAARGEARKEQKSATGLARSSSGHRRAVALGLALGIQAFLVKPFRIPSESMVPTLEVGQRVLVDRVGLRFGDPEPRGHRRLQAAEGRGPQHLRRRAAADGQPCPKPTPEQSDTNFIKRVVGVPGRPAQGASTGASTSTAKKLRTRTFIAREHACENVQFAGRDHEFRRITFL